MPVVEFRPSGNTVEVNPGTSLLDASRLANVLIDAPCGGNGTCGKCAVVIVNGDIESTTETIESPYSDNSVLACKAKVLHSNVIIEIPQQDFSIQDRHEEPEEYEKLLKQKLQGISITPVAEKVLFSIPKPEMDDGISDLERIKKEIKKTNSGIANITFSLKVIQTIAETLRQKDGRITVTMATAHNHCQIIDIEGGHSTTPDFGIAIDIGTTTISVQLVDLISGIIIDTVSGYNDQIPCGLDVISRINYALNEKRRNDLQTKVLSTINRLISSLCKKNDITNDHISGAVVSGNTVMIHLLMALHPEYIRLEPYTPTVLKVPTYKADELQIKIKRDAPVNISSSVGSYVGGDIVSGLLCTDIYSGENISLFIDIGTNGELVIGSKEFLLACACSAGPAFEGGGISCGMRAAEGAINEATVDPETGKANITVTGNGSPIGICGSGMIDLLAQLYIHGWIDASGKINQNKNSEFITTKDKKAFYTIATAEESRLGKAITISETDIDNIIRTKGAIYSACNLLLENIGITFNGINHFYIAGGFGKHLNIKNAITLGMLPDVSPDKYIYLGNTSLAGSALQLLSEEYRNIEEKLAESITYINLSNEPGYMDQYTAALFIPHTDFNQFPSVVKKK